MSKILGKRRRGSDYLEKWLHQNPKFCVMSAVVPRQLRNELEFIINKSVLGEPVEQAILVIKTTTDYKPRMLEGLSAQINLCTATGWYGDIDNSQHTCGPDVRVIMDHMSRCYAFLLGMLPNMGRNESTWVEIDEDTRKRVRSPADSYVRRAFVLHTLGEHQLVKVIFSFL